MIPPATDSFFSRSPADEPPKPWRWAYQDTAGQAVEVAGVPQGFPTQADAESWLGESWRDLLDKGVDQVSLLEGDREVYGPMSLHA